MNGKAQTAHLRTPAVVRKRIRAIRRAKRAAAKAIGPAARIMRLAAQHGAAPSSNDSLILDTIATLLRLRGTHNAPSR